MCSVGLEMMSVCKNIAQASNSTSCRNQHCNVYIAQRDIHSINLFQTAPTIWQKCYEGVKNNSDGGKSGKENKQTKIIMRSYYQQKINLTARHTASVWTERTTTTQPHTVHVPQLPDRGAELTCRGWRRLTLTGRCVNTWKVDRRKLIRSMRYPEARPSDSAMPHS